MRGVDRQRIARAGQSRQPSPDAQPRPRRHPCRAGLMHRPGQHDEMAAPIFMAGDGRLRPMCAPQARRIEEIFWADRRQHIRLNADLHKPHLAAGQPTRHQDMAGLEAEKCHGKTSVNAFAAGRAIRAVEAGGHIDSHDRRAAGVDLSRDGEGFAVQWPRQAGAEHRVDHDACAGLKLGQSARRPRPLRESQRGVALQGRGTSQRADPYLKALFT